MDALCCARCAYDLRTLDVAGLCPECATPVADSVAAAADPLFAVGPRLRWACGVLLAALVLRVGFTFALIAYYIHAGINVAMLPRAVSITLSPWPANEVLSGLSRLPGATPLIGGLTLWFAAEFFTRCAGIWLLTSHRQPGGASVIVRWAARWAMVAGLVMAALPYWRPVALRVEVLFYAPSTWAAEIGPPVAIAMWTGHLWAHVRAARGLAFSPLLALTLIGATGAAMALRPRQTEVAWLSMLAVVAAALLHAYVWLDVWRLSARRPLRAAPPLQ